MCERTFFPSDVGFGSLADITAAMELVRFVPEAEVQGCLFSKTDDFPAAIPS
jgi:hypothetical protein